MTRWQKPFPWIIFLVLLVRNIVTVWDKKHGRPWCTSAQNPNFNVCMFANIGIWILRRCTLMPAFFWHLQTKGYLDRYFALIKLFAQIWNNLSEKWIYVKVIIFASILCVSVLFVPYVLCSNFGWSNTALVEYQKQVCLFCGEKNVSYLSPRKKNLATVLDFTQNNVLF